MNKNLANNDYIKSGVDYLLSVGKTQVKFSWLSINHPEAYNRFEGLVDLDVDKYFDVKFNKKGLNIIYKFPIIKDKKTGIMTMGKGSYYYGQNLMFPEMLMDDKGRYQKEIELSWERIVEDRKLDVYLSLFDPNKLDAI